tara:strand:+ start:2237 stop:3304 length:1068 start_codon:yes stop_codon:yes gene_type:complete
MSSNFAYRYVSITPEHTTTSGARSYGTASAGGSAKIYGEVDDESIAHNFDLMTRADMSRYGAAKSVNGKEFSEGGVNLVIQADDFCGILFYGAYGDNASANSGKYVVASNKHTMTEGLDHILPSFTLEVGREDKEHTYTGMCLSRLSVSGSVGEYATMSVDFSGKAESAVSALATPTFAGATVEGLHFAEGEITFSSDNSTTVASSNIKSISMEISTNLNTDDACSIGSRTYVRQPEPQMREITGSVEFSRPSIGTALSGSNQDPQYDLITATGGEEYDGTLTAPAISLKFTQGATAVLKIDIPKVRWEAPSMNVSGRDSSTMSLNFVALVDDNMAMSEVEFETLGTTVGRYSTL